MSVRALRSALILVASCLPAAQVLAATDGCKLGIIAELPVTMNAMRPTITTKINGEDARFIVDSGAFFSVIAEPSAAQYKLQLKPAPFDIVLEGIGGSSHTQLTTVKEFTIAGVVVRKVDFLVGGSVFRGAIGVLGQNVLRIADVEYDLANGAIRLMKPTGCGARNMAYWGKPGDAYSEMTIDWASVASPHTAGDALLNGKKIRVVFDTGASTSMLSRRAAERVGVTPESPGVVKAGLMTSGIGSRSVQTWLGPFESFKLGGEEIRNMKLRFGDASLDADMLIGADFFLSHRVYVASSQRKVYFTYNGGPVFNLAQHPEESPQSQVAEDQPTDAAGFSRRGAAFAARRDYPHALEDLTRACELAPTEPEYFYQRARAYLDNRQPQLAFADVEQVLTLRPDHVPGLVLRAGLNSSRSERAGRADNASVLEDLNKASAAAAKEDDVHFDIGILYSRVGAYGLAITQYDLWLDKHPPEARTPDAYANRCRSRALLGLELDKALSDCNRAVRGRDDVPFFLESRGMVELRMGRYDKAIGDYDSTLKIQPKNAWALYGRGLAKLHKGRKADGEADIAAAKESSARVVAEAARHGLTP